MNKYEGISRISHLVIINLTVLLFDTRPVLTGGKTYMLKSKHTHTQTYSPIQSCVCVCVYLPKVVVVWMHLLKPLGLFFFSVCYRVCPPVCVCVCVRLPFLQLIGMRGVSPVG